MCIERKTERFISGESKKIFRIKSHNLLIGLTIDGNFASQEEEEIREDSSIVRILFRNNCVFPSSSGTFRTQSC